MATPRILCELLMDTEARAIQIRDAIIGDLTGKDVRRSSFNVSGPDDLLLWLCNGDVEFNVELDAMTWQVKVVSRWTTGALANRILVGSRIHRHRCPHPDGERSYNCRDDVLAQFIEDIKA